MPKSARNTPVTVSKIPRNLHQAILRIQVENDIDFDEACEKAAILMGQNSKIFDERVAAKANSLYKQRFLTEINKARETISKNGLQQARDQGYAQGYTEGNKVGRTAGITDGVKAAFPDAWEIGYREASFRWKFNCKNCGRPGTLTDNEWNELKRNHSEILSHADCSTSILFETLVQKMTNGEPAGERYEKVRKGIGDILTAIPPKKKES